MSRIEFGFYDPRAEEEAKKKVIGIQFDECTEKENKMVSEKVKKSFIKVAGTAIATVGEAAQADLILIGIQLGFTEDELRAEVPLLFEEVKVEELDMFEHYSDPEEEKALQEESENEW